MKNFALVAVLLASAGSAFAALEAETKQLPAQASAVAQEAVENPEAKTDSSAAEAPAQETAAAAE